MPHLIKPWIVRYIQAGSRVPKGTKGAMKVRERASKWYGVGVPGYPPKKRFPLASNKEAARRMLDNMVRGAEQGQAQVPDRDAARLSLKTHLDQFAEELALGLVGKAKKLPPSTSQVSLVVQRVRDVLDGCGFVDPPDLNSGSPTKLAKYLNSRLGKSRKDADGLSAQSAAFYLAAARRFARWMSKRAPVAHDLFDGLPGFAPQNDRRHARREVSPDELARLIETTRDSARVIRHLTGPDRAMLYLVAFATGYRAGELAVLTPESFELDADLPAAVLRAKATKNKKRARQPLPPGVVYQLRNYLQGKPAGKPVWDGTWKDRPVSVLCRDLKAAKVPYKTTTPDGDRYADFHALRHSYLSALAAAGVGIKELQELARHSDPRITLGIYTHARQESLSGAVGRLQLPGMVEENPLARLSRAELESAIVALAAVVQVLVAPTVAPAMGIPRECPGQAGTKAVFVAEKRAHEKTPRFEGFETVGDRSGLVRTKYTQQESNL